LKGDYENKYYTIIRSLRSIIDEKELNQDYKMRYYSLITLLGKLHYDARYNRCPPLKSCCGMCNKLKDIIEKEKNGRITGNLGSDEGLYEHKQ
jgi:hypothetical protein